MTDQEKEFLKYWKQERNRGRNFSIFWKAGLPLGIVIGIGIVMNLITGWYNRANMVLNTNPSVILVLFLAILLIILFISYFTARHRWDMNELRYRELMQKEKRNSES